MKNQPLNHKNYKNHSKLHSFHKKLLTSSLLTIFLTILLTSCSKTSNTQDSSLESRISQLEEENEDLTAAIKILSDRIQDLEDKY